MLGETTEAVLTIVQGESAIPIGFRFVTPVGYQMRMARNDAMRYIHVKYPNWKAGGAELTFEDRSNKHEGSSIGTALAVLVRSAIDGFQIDPNSSITGDITANGKVLPIGGVYAKVHGAEASKCRLMGLPLGNFESLVNTESFIASGEVPQVQVIGIGTVDEAVALLRTDRSPGLSEAIELYDQVTQNYQQSTAYLHSPDCAAQLEKILQLAPHHFSAQLLKILAEGTRPKTLSATASLYYVSVAVQEILPIIEARAKESLRVPPSAVVTQGLSDLGKLRPVSHPRVVPLIDAWVKFIRIASSVESGMATPRYLDAQWQAVLDAMFELEVDPELMQKMLSEGM